MLLSMHIENIATIKQMDIDFGEQFNVLTGETGAGKSILIDSIGLLLGDRFDRSLIRTGEQEALVTGLVGRFDEDIRQSIVALGIALDDEGNLLISRQITADGKSKARINGMAVSVAVLKSVGELAISILGQSDHQLLRDENSYIDYLDRFASVCEELSSYQTVYRQYMDIDAQLKALSMSESERIRMVEMLTYQLKDIEALGLEPGEDEKLLAKEKMIKNSERIEKNARFAYMALKGADKGSATYILERTIASVEKLSDVVPDAPEMIEQLRDCVYKIEDIAGRVNELLAYHQDEDPIRALDQLEERLAAIERLKRKYGNTVDEILQYAKELKAKLATLTDMDDQIEDLEKKKNAILAQLEAKAQALHEARKKASKEMSSLVLDNLYFLDMENARFEVVVNRLTNSEEQDAYRANGGDEVLFMISANKGEDMRSLAKVASGGELARIMLALHTVIADHYHVGTMIFDEIDTGVSGKTARKLGIKLLSLSRAVQVLCVTHSAQVASLSDTHFLIRKKEKEGRTETFTTALDEKGRLEEVARIIGGIHVTDAQRRAAEDMLGEKPDILAMF